MIGKRDAARCAPGLLAAILAGSALAAGCGQRGPLVLPKVPPQVRPAAPAPAPAPASVGAAADASKSTTTHRTTPSTSDDVRRP